MARYDCKIKKKVHRKNISQKNVLYREVFKITKINNKRFELEIWIYEFNSDDAICMEFYVFDSLAKLKQFKLETCEMSPFPLNPHIYN